MLLVGNALEIRNAGFLWLKLAEYSKKYGGILTIWLLWRPVVVLTDHRIVNELFEKRSLTFSHRPIIQMADLAGWGDSILFTQYNQRLRTYRRLLHQTFNSRATLDFQELQKDEVHKLMKRLADMPGRFMQHAHLMAGSVAIRIAYGHTADSSEDEFIRSAEEFMNAVGEATIPGRWMVETIPLLRLVPSWMPGAGFKRRTREWARMTVKHRQAPFDEVIKNMAEGTAEPCFTTKLLEPEDSTNAVGAEERDDQKTIASSLYGAGADTTSALLQCFFLAMTLYPDVQAKAQTEIDKYLSHAPHKSARMLDISDEEHLPYTKALVSEIIRWHPVINLAVHNTGRDEEIACGYRIPGNTMVIANICAHLHIDTPAPDYNLRSVRFAFYFMLLDALVESKPADTALAVGKSVKVKGKILLSGMDTITRDIM
ncbi:cytochrome P450 family protein [Ceratobasidium sp. AG-Ba]|nr:cytochrome P450 family protein [Ceratobasidium sp. AG-Ba]